MSRTYAPEWAVMHAVLAQGGLWATHQRLADVAGVDRRTVSNVIRNHLDERLMVGGRPARLGPGMGLVVGLSLGAESLRGGIVDANGDVHHPVEEEPMAGQLEQSPERLFERLRDVAARVLARALEDESLWGRDEGVLRLLGVAVAWPSPIDRLKRPGGRALRDGSWRRRDPATRAVPTLTERTAEAFGDPFRVDRCHALNDVSAHALAIAFENCRLQAYEADEDQWKVALVVRVGGGLGSSIIVLAPHTRRRLSFIDSLLIEGTNGFAGELGHLAVDRSVIEELNEAGPKADLAPMSYDEWRCSCQRLHHLEAFASGSALIRRLQASGSPIPQDGRGRASFIRAALRGDAEEMHVEAVRDVGRVLGRALAAPILMLDPHSITFTGSLATAHLVDGIRRERDAWANAINDSVEISYREGFTGTYAGVRGAALAVIRRHVYRNFLDRQTLKPPTFAFGSKQLARLHA